MKLKKLGIIVFLGLVVSAAVGSIFYTMYRLQDHQEFLGDYSAEVDKIEKAQGKTITLTETKAGKRKWVLKMKEIKYSKDNRVATLKSVKGLVYSDKQKVLFAFTSPSGKYFKKNNQIVLNKGAKVISPTAQIVLTAPLIDWSAQSDMVKASGGVKMAKKGFGISQAKEALFAMDFSKVQFQGNAVSVIGSHSNTGD